MSRRSLSLGLRRPGADMARTRSGGRRWVPIVSACCFVLVLVGSFFLVRWMRHAPVFMVDRLETGRYQFSTSAEVEGLLAERLGTNIWTCDTDSLLRDLEALPWVRSAEITRKPPGTLSVRLKEWRPRLLVAVDGGQAVDALLDDGRILPVPAHMETPELPVFRAGGASPAEQTVATLLALVEAIGQSGLDARTPVTAIGENGTGMVVDLGPGVGRLLVGRESFMRRLKRYLAVADDLPPASSVDLRFQGQVYVRELEDAQQSG